MMFLNNLMNLSTKEKIAGHCYIATLIKSIKVLRYPYDIFTATYLNYGGSPRKRGWNDPQML
jgi:hypothetical protein